MERDKAIIRMSPGRTIYNRLQATYDIVPGYRAIEVVSRSEGN